MKKRWTVTLLLIAILLITDFSLAQGCSQCKMISSQSTEAGEASFASNINKGILFLLTIPYLIVAFWFRKNIANFFRRIFGKQATSAS